MVRKSFRTTAVAIGAAGLLALASACGDDNGDAPTVDEVTDTIETAVDDAADALDGDDEGADAQDGDTDAGAEETTTVEIDGQEHELPATIAEKYEELQETHPHLGAPVGEPIEIAGGHQVDFEGGTLFGNPDGDVYLVQGAILEEYNGQGGPESDLGWPTSDEMADDAGFSNTFENGTITFANDEVTVEMEN